MRPAADPFSFTLSLVVSVFPALSLSVILSFAVAFLPFSTNLTSFLLPASVAFSFSVLFLPEAMLLFSAGA